MVPMHQRTAAILMRGILKARDDDELPVWLGSRE